MMRAGIVSVVLLYDKVYDGGGGGRAGGNTWRGVGAHHLGPTLGNNHVRQGGLIWR